MPAAHRILELRTSQNAENTPETAAQLFAALPKLRQMPWDLVLGRDEHLSFEIVVLGQTIYFLCYLPERLIDYVSSLFESSYPEILISPLEHDPLAHFQNLEGESLGYIDQQSRYLELGLLKLRNSQNLPLKTFRDFTDVDPLATVLSSLSKSRALDKLAIQFVISRDNFSWAQTQHADAPHKKTGALQVDVRMAVKTQDPIRSTLLLETITAAFQSMTYSDSNSLELRRVKLFKSRHLQNFLERKSSFFIRQHLSLDELATLYHFPNKSLSHISNIAWGKNLLG